MRFRFVAARYLLKKKIFTKHTFKIISKAMKLFLYTRTLLLQALHPAPKRILNMM